MKTKLLNNLPFKIISVIAAIVLWLIVVNIDDTVETDVFKNLPVTLINTDTLTSQDRPAARARAGNRPGEETRACEDQVFGFRRDGGYAEGSAL